MDREQEGNSDSIYWITNSFAFGARSGADGPSLVQLGARRFRHVIDLNADPEERLEARRLGINYHGLRVTDDDSPTTWLEVLKEAVRVISAAEGTQERVFIHCTYGVGRSPTFAMAWLVHQGYSVDRAIEFVRRRRPGTWGLGNPIVKYREILDAYARSLTHQTALVELSSCDGSLNPPALSQAPDGKSEGTRIDHRLVHP